MSHGKQFEKDLLKSIRAGGAWAERFRDNTWSDMRGSNESPPDMIVINDGRPSLFELKAVTCGHDGKGNARMLIKGSISVKRCQGHQLERLIDFERNHGGRSFVVVMFYTLRASKRCAVIIPIDYWINSPKVKGRDTIRLADLRAELSPVHHLKWVGRKDTTGPYRTCRRLHEDLMKDIA